MKTLYNLILSLLLQHSPLIILYSHHCMHMHNGGLTRATLLYHVTITCWACERRGSCDMPSAGSHQGDAVCASWTLNHCPNPIYRFKTNSQYYATKYTQSDLKFTQCPIFPYNIEYWENNILCLYKINLIAYLYDWSF